MTGQVTITAAGGATATTAVAGPAASETADRILDAADDCVLAFGVDRVTLAEIARRAGLSRPTVYRRFPDTRSILAAVLTRRITGALDAVPSAGVGRRWLVERIIGVRMGTGGSAGAEYLRSTLFRPAFPDLWDVRSV